MGRPDTYVALRDRASLLDDVVHAREVLAKLYVLRRLLHNGLCLRPGQVGGVSPDLTLSSEVLASLRGYSLEISDSAGRAYSRGSR